jgi:hypothetical protein
MDLEQQLATDRVEARSVAFTDVDTSKDGWSFEGLAAVYDQETDLGQYTESMARGSYRKVLSRGENVPMLHDHNVMLPDFKRLLDVSPTWEPAYAGTSAELRSLRALQMAEDVDQAQQILTGAVPQLEDGAPVDEAEPGESEAEKGPEDATCEKCGETIAGEHECAEGEQRSGVEAADYEVAAAARRRRLQMLGLALPRA